MLVCGVNIDQDADLDTAVGVNIDQDTDLDTAVGEVKWFDPTVAANWVMMPPNTNTYVVDQNDHKTHIRVPQPANCFGFIVQSTSTGATLMVQTPRGRYGFPKGKRHRKEHPLCCALRELQEETGLTAGQLSIQPTTYAEINEKGNCPTVYFYAWVDGEPFVECLDDEEDLAVSWMTRTELEALPESEFYQRRRILLF